MTEPVDLLLLSLGTTRGLRVADAQLAEMLREAGATVAVVGTRIGATDRLRRGYPVNDLVEALAARRALAAGLRRHRPRAIVFSTTTAALLAGRPEPPFAVWLDSPARLNRPGMRNLVLHLLERRQLARARLVLTLSPAAAAALPARAAPPVVISPPIDADPRPSEEARADVLVGYTPDPKAKDLALLCAGWAEAGIAGMRLIVTGIPVERARAFLARRGLTVPDGVELAGALSADEFHSLLARARAFVSSARWEDFGLAPLEALERGTPLVCAPAGGPFPALAIARELAPRLVAADRSPAALAAAIRASLALDGRELEEYRAAAKARLEPYRRGPTIARLRDQVLPALLGR